MLRRHIVLLTEIRPSDGDVKPGGPLGLFEKRRLWAGTGFHLLPSFHYHHHTITLHKHLHIQPTSPQLLPVHYTDIRPTHNVVCPNGAWIENWPHSMPSIRLAWNPKRIIVQWVGIETHTHTHTYFCNFGQMHHMGCGWINRKFYFLINFLVYLFDCNMHFIW